MQLDFAHVGLREVYVMVFDVRSLNGLNCNIIKKKGRRKKVNEEQIKRINELYHKSKNEGLTAEEKIEQATLRKEYIEAIRKNLRSNLNNISILNPDGSVTDLSKFDRTKKHEN